MTCMFHAWQFDMKGRCAYISRQEEGYQDRLKKEDVGLRELNCELYFGGFVWICLADDMGMNVEEMGRRCIGCVESVAE